MTKFAQCFYLVCEVKLDHRRSQGLILVVGIPYEIIK